MLTSSFRESTSSCDIYGGCVDNYQCAPTPDRKYGAAGFALDIGGQYTFKWGLVLSGGIQYMSDGPEDFGSGDSILPSVSNLFWGGGFRPRVLSSIGYAFL